MLERAGVLRRVRGGAIIIDAGTTTGRLAQVLPTDRELTVVGQRAAAGGRPGGPAQA